MTTTALLLVIGTAIVLAVLLVSQRQRGPRDDDGPGLLAGSDESAGPSWLGPAMRVIISIAVLGASLYVILSNKYDADTSRWAFGTAGTIVGFWLRGI